MCGEMAGETLSIPLLIGMKLNNLSMSPSRIPKARRLVNNLRQSDCKQLLSEALKLETCEQVNGLVEKFLKERKLI